MIARSVPMGTCVSTVSAESENRSRDARAAFDVEVEPTALSFSLIA